LRRFEEVSQVDTISTRKAAKMLGVSLSTVQRYVDNPRPRKELKAKKNPITGRREVYVSSVLDMMNEYGIKGGK
jgi:transposase